MYFTKKNIGLIPSLKKIVKRLREIMWWALYWPIKAMINKYLCILSNMNILKSQICNTFFYELLSRSSFWTDYITLNNFEKVEKNGKSSDSDSIGPTWHGSLIKKYLKFKVFFGFVGQSLVKLLNCSETMICNFSQRFKEVSTRKR